MAFHDPRTPILKIDNGRDFFIKGVVGHRDIYVTTPRQSMEHPFHTTKYNGRRKVWTRAWVIGAVLLLSLLMIAVAGRNHYVSVRARIQQYNLWKFYRKSIRGGSANGDAGGDLADGDGVIGNPTKYPASKCALPNYLSKKRRIVAVSANGTEVPINIKGVNWFGMETDMAVPFGLWDNDTAGTTAYHIASFLATNNFNTVRLPVMVDHILKNAKPNKGMINAFTNQALVVKDYLSLLKSIIKVLQFRRIGVLISVHTLTSTDNGGLWHNEDISEADFLQSYDILTSTLCTNEYWNVVGLDLKNEPYKAKWGSDSKPESDFRRGAALLAERMLTGCPQWLAFVEGLNYKSHDVVIDGENVTYSDWYGGGLQDVKAQPLELSASHKIVWAPHYYTSAVFVQPYFYEEDEGTIEPDTHVINGFVELSDKKLKDRVAGTMEDMFGYLVDEEPQYAVVLGEFGGIYARDAHPKRTIQRIVDYNVQVMLERGYAGGFLWSLNPESKYQYVSADTGSPVATFDEGLLQRDWLTANSAYLEAVKPLDALPDLRKFPCFPS